VPDLGTPIANIPKNKSDLTGSSLERLGDYAEIDIARLILVLNQFASTSPSIVVANVCR
jgi:hypothetical protein